MCGWKKVLFDSVLEDGGGGMNPDSNILPHSSVENTGSNWTALKSLWERRDT